MNSALKDMEQNFLLLQCELNSDFLPKITYEKGENNFIVEKSDKHYLWWSRLTLTVISHIDSMYLWDEVIRRPLYLSVVFLSKTIIQSNHEKNIRQTQVEEYSTNTWLPQNHQDHQQRKSEKLSQNKGA